jgi:hypothetical protein
LLNVIFFSHGYDIFESPPPTTARAFMNDLTAAPGTTRDEPTNEQTSELINLIRELSLIRQKNARSGNAGASEGG